jgi:hypothetical protein
VNGRYFFPAYAGIGLTLFYVFQYKGYAVPAGICATFAVTLTPLGIYGLQLALGLWANGSTYQEYHRYIKWHWLYMEFGTLIVGAIVTWRYIPILNHAGSGNTLVYVDGHRFNDYWWWIGL